MSGGTRLKSSALAVCVAAAVAGPIAACSSSQTHASAAGSPKPAPTLGRLAVSADPSVFNTDFEAYEPRCTVALAGSEVQVTFIVPDLDTCGEDTTQLASVVGGDWQNQQNPASMALSVPVACVVDRGGEDVTVADGKGDAAGAGICRRLIAAGWTENKKLEQLDRMIVVLSASPS